jgi:hypothetical protein
LIAALLVVLFFSCAAEIVLVVPVLVLWPAARRPPVWIGGFWGVLVAWGFYYGPSLLQPDRSAMPTFLLGELVLLAAAGAASGLVYALLASKRFNGQ